MKMIDKKIDCVASRKTCRYWEKGRKKKNLVTSGLDPYQYSNNTIILFVTQYKNDNTAFYRCAVCDCLALLRAFVSGRLNTKKVLSERLDTEEHGWARERCRPSVCKWLRKKNGKERTRNALNL